MPEPLTLTLLSTVTDAVFSYLLAESGLADKVRAWLGREPARLAFQTALARAYTAFAEQRPQWVAALLDKGFLTREEVVAELAQFLTRRGAPDPAKLAQAWAGQLPPVRAPRREEAARALADFLRHLDRELGEQEALRPVYDSRALERIATNTEALQNLLKETLDNLSAAVREAGIQVHGSVWGSVLITGHHNVVYNTVLSTYPNLKDYIYDFSDTIDQLTRWFEGREFLLAEVDAFIRTHDRGIFRLVADAGLGKSAVAAMWAKYYKAPIFFFGSRGSTSPARCLAHLCAELIGRYQLNHAHLPARAEEDANFLKTLLREAREKSNRPAVLVIDALDEAEGASTGYWIPLPDPLPEGAYILVTHRHGDYPLPDAVGKTFFLTWDDPRQQADIERHLRRQVQRSEIRHALESASSKNSPEQFVAALKEASEGNFMYLTYVLQDIEQREPGFDPLRLDELPRGLHGYYDLFWQRMGRVKGQEGWAEWRDLYKPAIALLAVAGEAVSPDWLADQVGRDAEEVRERVLHPWRRFLRRERRDGRERWFIIHRSFADFVGERVDLRAFHRRVAEYYRASPDRWSAHAGYALRHLTYHLAGAGMFDELAALVETPAWHRVSLDHDPSGQLLAQDLERALAWAEGQVLKERRIEALPQVVAWSLAYATVRSRATKVPLAALEAMVLLGQSERARRYAALITEPKQQTEAYLRIGHHLLERGEQGPAHDTLRQALDAAQTIQDMEARAKALAAVAQALAQLGEIETACEALYQALDAIQKLETGWLPAETLATVAQSLAKTGKTQQALSVVKAIRSSLHRVKALVDVAYALAQIGKTRGARDALGQALDTAQSILAADARAHALAIVAPALAQMGETLFFPKPLWPVATLGSVQIMNHEALRRALDAAQAIKDAPRAGALIAVAKALVQVEETDAARGALHQALEAAQTIEKEWERAEALTAVARAFAQVGDREGLRQAIAAAQTVEGEYPRGHTLAAVAQTFAQVGDREGLRQALATAQTIEKEWERAEALTAVARAFAQVGDREGLRQAIATAQTIEEEWERSLALAAMANALPQVGDREGLRWISAAAQNLKGEEPRARALAAVAKALAQIGEHKASHKSLSQALATVQNPEGEGARSRALVALARALSQVGETEAAKDALRQALAAAQTIEGEWERAEALTAMAQAFAQVGDREGLRQALDAAQKIEEMDDRAHVLTAVAQALAQVGDREGLRQALQVAQAIEREGNRAEALAAVAHALAQVGETDAAKEALRQSLAVAQDFEDRAHALTTVAQALAQVGKTETAKEALRQALAAAQNIENGNFQASALATVAQVLAQVGKTETAKEALRQALAAAQNIENGNFQASALATVAQVLAQVGEIETACEALYQALDTIQNLETEWLHTETLAAVAQVLAQVEDREGLRRVMAAAQNIEWEWEWERAEALTAVAQALAQVGDRESLRQALHATQTIQDMAARAEALAAVAQALAQVGETAAAQEALRQALQAAQAIEEEWARAHALTAVAQALALVTAAGDLETARWTVEALQRARERGREKVLNHIAAFAPVLGKLGVIKATWARLQAVEALFS